MKLNPEFPERRTLNHILRSPEGEIVNTIRPDAAKAGSLRQTALSPALFKELALSLGLPRDTLSAALLSLAKFFSLPLDAKLIRQLRRQALSLPVPEPPSPEGARVPARPNLPLAGTIRSAALAAAAAAGKGVALSPEALGGYAAALAAGLAVNLRDETEDEPGTEGGDMPEGPKDGPPPFDDSHVLVEGIEGRLPLLGVLNRIPGKDGRRWIALPFSFRSGDLDYHVSLRIVLADTNSIPWKAERMALDIKTFRRRWSFMLENPAGKEGRFFGRAVFGAQPALNPKAERGLRKLLGSIAGKTVLRDISGGAFPEEEWGAGQWEP